MNSQSYKGLFEAFDDYAVRELDNELAELNEKIDRKVKRGKPYKKESRMHKEVVKLRDQILYGC